MPDNTRMTGRSLHARLREVLGASTDEELAQELGTSVRDVTRLKNPGFGPNQMKFLGMLDVAGWLTPDATLAPEEARKRAEVYGRARRSRKLSLRQSQEDH